MGWLGSKQLHLVWKMFSYVKYMHSLLGSLKGPTTARIEALTFTSPALNLRSRSKILASILKVCLYVLRGHLLGKGWPLGSRLWCLLWICHFPIGILGQVWYLIVSIPDLCNLTYFDKFNLRWNISLLMWTLTLFWWWFSLMTWPFVKWRHITPHPVHFLEFPRCFENAPPCTASGLLNKL